MSESLFSLWIMVGAQAWQLALLIVAVWILHYCFARQRPHLAMALWLVVLAKCVTPPLWSSPSGVFCWIQPPRLSVDTSMPPISLTKGFADETWKVVDTTNEEQLRSIESNMYIHDQPVSLWRFMLLPRQWWTATFDPRASHSWKISIPWLIGVWLTGLSLFGTISLLHWLRFVRQLKRTTCCTNKQLAELVDDLARRLGVRQSVRVLVSSGRTGPAVIGLWRPRIVMPAILVDKRQFARLEPLLAHELLHVRRGDLWLSLLQAVARTVWWFHPFVWMAMSRISREAERCCDEAVLAELGYEPSHYARSLLDVLERKRMFRAVPMFPGVRPVDITTSRLERIMSLRHGCRRRSPWWCWAIAVGFASVILPGARFLVEATEPTPPAYQVVQPPKRRTAPAAWRLADVPETETGESERSEPSPIIVKSYAVRDLVEKFKELDQLDEATSKNALLQWLKQSLTHQHSSHVEERVLLGHGVNSDVGVTGELIVDESSFAWFQDQLVVKCDVSGHQRLANEIERRRKYGFAQVSIRAWIVSNDTKSIRKLHNRWDLFETPPNTAATATSTDTASPDDMHDRLPSTRPQITATTEKHYPSQVAILNAEQAERLMQRVQSDPRGNLMQVPKVTLFNGQRAVIQDTTLRPFVVGFRRTASDRLDARSDAMTNTVTAELTRQLPPGFEPDIRIITEGITMRVCPVLGDNACVTVDFDIRLAAVRQVETTQLRLASELKPVKVQVPVVSSMQVASAITCRIGDVVIVGGLEMVDADGKSQSMLVLLSPELPPWEANAVNRE